MPQITTTIRIARPPTEVFRYVTTPANWPRWHPASVAVEGATDHPLDVGEQVTEDFCVAGRRGRATWIVRERQPDRRWVIEAATDRRGHATITYTLTAQPGGTEFRRDLVYAVHQLYWRLLDRLLLRPRVRAESEEALRRLKAVLETPAA
jgi:uncharacterized protein YndB with AHSA1/START domain